LNKSSVSAAWLYAAIVSMMFMGIYALLVGLSRTPGLNTLFPSQDFFRVALMTHVVLSLLIWFLAFIMFLAYRVTGESSSSTLARIPAVGAYIGIAMIVITPFTGPVTPILNNYVPVLDHGLYLTGVVVFLVSAVAGWLLVAPALWRYARGGAPLQALVGGSLLSAGVALIAGVVCFALAWSMLGGYDQMDDPKTYYESLFWGGGHVLQFTNTFAVMAVWALLARMAGKGDKLIPTQVAVAILATMILFVLVAPFAYFMNPADSHEARMFFLELKRWGAGIGAIAVGAAAVFAARVGGADPVASRGLSLSIFLYGLGGLIALTLQGSDTRVPAHYHGVIGAVTLAFMTYALKVTTLAGWMPVKEKWQKRQVTFYGLGQSLFVTGLFIGGLAGLPRKTFGAAQELDSVLKKTGMGVMGIGTILAVSGGVMFIIFMLRAFFSKGKNDA